MYNLLNFIFLFVGMVLFLPNNSFTSIYIIFSLIVFFAFLIVYLISRKKHPTFKENWKVNLYQFMILLMIVVMNSICKYEIINLIYLSVLSTYFLVRMLVLILKKDYLFQNKFLHLNNILEVYTYTYLIITIFDMAQYAF